MALSNESYMKAKDILNDISSKSSLPIMEVKSKDDEWKTDYILYDNWHNGGPEAIWINIEKPSQQQIDKFHSRKGDVVCFGWL